MSDIDKIKNYISKDIVIELVNSEGIREKFYFKPMKMKEQLLATRIFKVLKKIQDQNKNKKDTEDFVMDEDLDESFVQQTFDLFMSIVKRSIIGISDDDAENFVQTNFDQLFSQIHLLIPTSKSKDELDSLKKAKERIENGQQNKTE